MKIKAGYVLRSLDDQHIVVPTGEEAINFNGIVTLNDTGKFLFERLQKGTDEETLVKELKNAYGIAEKTAKEDVIEFVNTLRKRNLLVE